MLAWFLTQSTTTELHSILQSQALKGAQVGVCVQDANGQTLFERNADMRFVPASNQKILTVLFALDTLGPNLKLRTSIWKSAQKVIVDAPGDPSLTLDELRKVRRRLKLFDNWPVHVRSPYEAYRGLGWEWDDLPWSYAATIAPFSFDRSAFDVWAVGGRLESLPPELQVYVKKTQSANLKVSFEPQSNVLTVAGHLPRTRTKLGSFAQAAPMAAAARALGGRLVVDQSEPPKRAADAVLVGKPIGVAAKECLEASDNVIAEQLLALASKSTPTGSKAKWSDFAGLEREHLAKEFGVSQELFRPVDGSGLSRHNQIAPLAMCKFLLEAARRPYRETWLESLAAGGEGTLRNRLKDSTFIGKTGTMDAVVSLSGYVTLKDGRVLVFSFFVNNSLAPASDVRSVQDRFVRALEKGIQPDDRQ